jgi:hypothetical protein
MNTNKQAQAIISDIRLKHGSSDAYAPIIRWDEFQVISNALEAAEKRIADFEAREEALRPVGVMSEKAFHRLERSDARFIALWPRPGIYLPRKRPEDGVLVYARTAGITVKEDPLIAPSKL